MNRLLNGEKLIPLTKVHSKVDWVPDQHIATWYRWVNVGLRSGTVRLEAVRVGSKLCTTEPALKRFFERLSHAEANPTDVNLTAHDRAEDLLVTAGF